MPRPPKPTDHLDKVRHLMGTMSDQEVAKKCGSTSSIVGRYRRKHGIPAYEGYKFGKGQKPPSKSTDKTAQSKPRRRRSKIDAYRDQVGKIPDLEIAEKAGVSVEGVRMYRRRHGIALEPSARRRRRRKPNAAAASAAAASAAAAAAAAAAATSTSPALDAFRDQIGSVPDSEIAVMADVSEAEVTKWRLAHGVSAAADPSPATPPVEGLQGYSVTIGGTEYIVLAADISEAAANAVRARVSGTISAIRHLGAALTW